jgi:hypothetical protein
MDAGHRRKRWLARRVDFTVRCAPYPQRLLPRLGVFLGSDAFGRLMREDIEEVMRGVVRVQTSLLDREVRSRFRGRLEAVERLLGRLMTGPRSSVQPKCREIRY